MEHLRTVSFGDGELSYLAHRGFAEPFPSPLEGVEFTGELRAELSERYGR